MMQSDSSAREHANVAILVTSQALFLIASITVMTLSGVVGRALSPAPALATLPISLMMVGTVLSTLPASLLMKRLGRRPGFIIGAVLGGAAGGAISVLGIAHGQFWLFCCGNLLLGVHQGFAMYYRFAAADVASESFRSRAISLVMAGGVAAAFLGPWNARFSGLLMPELPHAGPYAVIAALALLAALLMTQLRVPKVAEPHAARPTRTVRTIARQPTFAFAVAAAAMGYTVMALVMTATPLAMRNAGFGMPDAAAVMQAHVLGMFVPSFFTGRLIARLGVLSVVLTGTAALMISALTAVAGTSLAHFSIALVMLGIGWNFLFVGGSTLLTQTHTAAERGLVQGVNDLAVFSLVAGGSLMAGLLLHQVGWATLNLLMIPPVTAVALGALWLRFGAVPGPDFTG